MDCLMCVVESWSEWSGGVIGKFKGGVDYCH